MSTPMRQQKKDEATLYAMGSIYCRAHHADSSESEHGICALCEETVAYSLARTASCPFGHKGNCNDCPIHCYEPGKREAIRAIMRYAAPRMIYRHPLMTARYLKKKITGKHKSPNTSEKGQA